MRFWWKTECSYIVPANKKELVTDLIVKAKQVEYLINSLPKPEPEEAQVNNHIVVAKTHTNPIAQAKRLQALEEDMNIANDEYIHAVNRASMFLSRKCCCIHISLIRRPPSASGRYVANDVERIRCRPYRK